MTDEAIPAATLIVVRDAAGRPARAADGRARRGHGVRRRRAGLPRRPDRRRPIARSPRSWESTAPRSPRFAKRSRRRRSPSACRRCPTRADRARNFSASWSPTGLSPSCSTKHGLELDADALTPFARWVPEVPCGAAVRHLVLRRAAPAGRLAAAGHRRRMRGRGLGHAPRRSWSASNAARRG